MFNLFTCAASDLEVSINLITSPRSVHSNPITLSSHPHEFGLLPSYHLILQSRFGFPYPFHHHCILWSKFDFSHFSILSWHLIMLLPTHPHFAAIQICALPSTSHILWLRLILFPSIYYILPPKSVSSNPSTICYQPDWFSPIHALYYVTQISHPYTIVCYWDIFPPFYLPCFANPDLSQNISPT